MEFISDRVENIVEKGENAGYQHFLLFLQCFQVFFPKAVKIRGADRPPHRKQNVITLITKVFTKKITKIPNPLFAQHRLKLASLKNKPGDVCINILKLLFGAVNFNIFHNIK